ncbi:MAG: InlB B-repeat-containing protein [Candidatus Gracilibacteria bacterium]|nr:InlB B-repeat-containing protein [Candidatus Gracilibacteria bacterium]
MKKQNLFLTCTKGYTHKGAKPSISKNGKGLQISKQAFTLVELIVVIAILAILGVIAFISLQGYSEQSRDAVRLSDMSMIKTGLELYEIESGKYPEPTNGVNITYSGAIVWTQGTFGESTEANVDKLNKKPTDPLTEKEYTYSVTTKRNEYELGGIVEGDEVVYSPLPRGEGIEQLAVATSLPLGEIEGGLYAGEIITKALVTGTYNGQMLKSNTGASCEVLGIPTIITNDTETSTDLLEIIANESLVFNGYKNLPSSFSGSKFKNNGGFKFIPNKLVVHTDNLGCITLSESENQRITLLKNLQDNYSGTILETNENYKTLITTEINEFAPNNITKIISRSIVSNYLKQKISESSLTFLNCEGGEVNGYIYGNIAHGLGDSVTKVISTSNGTKNYGALAVCNNGVIQINNENINTICDSSYVEQDGLCVQDICGNTVPSNASSTATSQSVSTNWLHNTTPGVCTFECNTNYTWNGSSCIADTQNTNCTSLPANAVWNTASNITQTWNGTTWLPIEIGSFNITSSTSTCNFICDTNYTWNGSSCIANTQSANCGGTISSNATATTSTTYTQTWNGSIWEPTTNWGENQATCDFDCDANYSWDTNACIGNSQTVTFDANGGTGHTPTSKSVTYNTAVGTLPSNPTRAGYTFNGWFTSTSGGTAITTSTVVTTNVTWYAQWTANNNTVTFDGNGSTGGSMSNQTIATNATATLTTNGYTRTGYTFSGWATTAGGAVAYANGASYTMGTTSVTLYAQWIQNGVCGSSNGVATTTAPTTNLCSVGTASAVTSNTGNFTWTCSVSGASTASCSATRQYTVTFNANGGGTPSPATKAVNYNTAVGTLATTTRSGYTFNGWFTATSGGTAITTSTVVTANVTWYAQWTSSTQYNNLYYSCGLYGDPYFSQRCSSTYGAGWVYNAIVTTNCIDTGSTGCCYTGGGVGFIGTIQCKK